MQAMRYYAVVQATPGAADRGVALGLMRFDPGKPERFDRESGEWRFYPDMLASLSGLGGASDYIEVPPELADQVLDAWRTGSPVPNVLAALRR
jgi:hypothetical protein